MIKVNNLSKSFGSQLLFDSVSFTINPKERVGLVGRNGHGKTTLFRIVIGEESADSGEVAIPRGYRIGYVTQQLLFTEDTVLAEACRGLPEEMHGETWMAEKILSGLGFTREEMARSTSEFSGGYQVRLGLARVLVSAPDLLLLDEPTNYLDIVSIRWLEKFLRQWKGELMVITHDRSFMNSVTTHTMGIHRKRIRKIRGDTDGYYEQILKEEEVHEKTRLNDEKKRKEVELYISRFRAKARLAGMVQSRIKALEKSRKLDRLEKIKTLDFSFSSRPFPARVVMGAENLSFSYGGEDLIRDFSITVSKNDRIAVIGKNGRGKTTLLRLLAGELSPRSGRVHYHGETRTGYFAQTNTSRLNPDYSVEGEIMASGCDRQRARDIAGAMMFEGDMALKRIGVISGGEKSRVLLGKILAQESNLLLLDEPTNHLDMESSDALLAAIDEFDGAVLIVTHNEMFLHTLANRFVVFQGGGISVFEGTYGDFLARVGWEDERDEGGQGPGGPGPGASKKELRRLRADILTRKSRSVAPLQARMAEVESSIEESEKRLEELNEEIIALSGSGEGGAIARLSKESHAARARIDALYGELDALMSEIEEKEAAFDDEMAGLGSE